MVGRSAGQVGWVLVANWMEIQQFIQIPEKR
jgi:hypothetical protein